MRRFFTVLAVLALLSTPAATAQDVFNGGRLGGAASNLSSGISLPGAELSEVENPVDLQQYAGLWYQVAAVPQPFSLQCTNNTTAEYGVIDAQTISVRNSCGTPFGQNSVIEGSATVRSDASLRVSFSGIPFQDPNGPVNYRITYLASDYSLAIVGDPQRRSGFVLSRTPALSAQQWQEVRATVSARGWWDCAFFTSPVNGGRGDATPLCLV
ncbi:lipocalin family protein [Corynebacterium callunae]|uniref:lipocalin family protein n=1 Tax=Corynebacterium callunae TaxID=1721 RepID=UPI00398268D9